MSERRQSLPEEREAVTHRFQIAGVVGYLTVGLYPDGTPGELFVRIAKEGSILKGTLDAAATAMSIGLQYGVPLEVFVDKFRGWAFEPSGVTQTPEIPIAQSVLDYIVRWLDLRFGGKEE